jgi:hypothetical protein
MPIGKLHWLVPPHVVERDEDQVLEAMVALTDAALQDLREVKETGLRHKSHQATLAPARAKLQKLFAGYFERQGAAVLAAVKQHIPRLLAAYQEADTKGKHFASSLIPSSLQPLRFEVTADEEDAYGAAIKSAIAGAAKTLAAEFKTSGSIPDEVGDAWLRENSLTKLTGGFSETSVQRLRDAVADAWDRGETFDGIVKAIQDTFEDFSTTRAEMIAQTEGNDAYLEGRDAMAHEMGMEEKIWSADGSNACEDCEDQIDAGYIDIDDDFPCGDDPPLHPRCFLAGTSVTAAGITGATRREYEGEIIVLGIAGVDDLSVTPNHPILTRSGWLPAGSLKTGDYIAQCIAPSKAAAVLNPDDYDIETRIEDIGNALFMKGGMMAAGVPISPEAFHGDRSANGKVDIVRAAGALPRAWSDGVEDGEYSSLGLRHSRRVAFLGERVFLKDLETVPHAPDGIVRSGGLRGARFFAHGTSADEASGTSAALLETEGLPPLQDSAAVNTDSRGNCEQAFASLVRLVKVDRIEVKTFRGHVYNLETQDGIYFANSIIAHNCDCGVDYRQGYSEPGEYDVHSR